MTYEWNIGLAEGRVAWVPNTLPTAHQIQLIGEPEAPDATYCTFAKDVGMLSLDVERALAALTSKLLHEPIPGFKPHRAEQDARQFALSAAGVTADITLREAQAKLLATAIRLDVAGEAALRRLEAFSTPTPAALAEFHIAARRARAAWSMYYHLPFVDSR